MAEVTPNGLLCCLTGSGSASDELYMLLVTGGTPVEGATGGTQLVALYIGGIARPVEGGIWGMEVGTLGLKV